MQYRAGNNFRGVRVRSTEGTTFWVTADSLADYVLHPVFLRFFAVVIFIFALLDHRPDFNAFDGWGMALLWSAVAATALLWIALCSPVIAAMLKRRLIVQVYTPVILIPMAVFAEIVIQLVTTYAGGAAWQAPSDMLQYVARDVIVVLLVDLLHANYVVHAHPLAQTGKPDTLSPVPTPLPDPPRPAARLPEPEATPPAEPVQDMRATDTVPEIVMVRIGPAVMPLASILVVRTEDHYLGVTSRSGKALHRAKMADVAELHSGLFGMQINRSVWIAYSAVKEVIEAESRQIIVQLVTGDEERVSKPRVLAFRQAYAKYRAGHVAAG
ncbi:hypothetical protein HYN69_00390 [Gemmobacter aquarius]|uniref:HTH LytTR-type domain-containing protein n=1 Tax=Paragemmobacter aquarius TaxID=2169400 RepID=A0A2S0UHG0_9RHOB|nr:LytTR family DNA-binding domain-containing protein [Gemmobacter aquarius]AWB47170.1 hypothetical protein HYN69_00390 [Gemmobacter aquarius]